MAFLYNEGCKKSEGDFSECIMNICEISLNKFEKTYCSIHPLGVYIQKHLNSDLNDPSRNVFTYEYYPPNSKSRMTILSNNDEDGILFLYEYNPYNNEYPEKTYLCRLRTTEQKITLCEAVNMEYLGRTLKFDSYDIINEENNKKNISSLKNPNHKIIKSKYDKLLFKRHPYHHIKTEYISYYNKKNILCKKINNDNMECTDANYGGRLIYLDDRYYDLNNKYLYVPNNCLGENLNSSCSPYICDIQATNEFVPCEYEEMSVVKNIRPINNIMPTKIIMPKKDMRPINEIMPCKDLMPCKYIMRHKSMLPPYNVMPMKGIRPIKNIGPNSKNPHAISLKNKDIYHENRLNNSALFAMSFMSFLVIFIFFFCLLYRTFRKKRRKIN